MPILHDESTLNILPTIDLILWQFLMKSMLQMYVWTTSCKFYNYSNYIVLLFSTKCWPKVSSQWHSYNFSISFMSLPVCIELHNSDDTILFSGKIMNILCILNIQLLWQKILKVKTMKSCVTCCELREIAGSSLHCSETWSMLRGI